MKKIANLIAKGYEDLEKGGNMQQFQFNSLLCAIIACFLLMAGCATTGTSDEEMVADESMQMTEEQPIIPEETVEYETASAEQVVEEPPPESEFPAGMELLTSENIYFKKGSADLTSEAQELLIEKAQWLLDNPQVKIIIQGHTDERGSAEYNLAFGERRAGSVKSFLLRQGIESSRLIAVSYGKERPAVLDNTENARTQNRRAHFVIEMLEYE